MNSITFGDAGRFLLLGVRGAQAEADTMIPLLQQLKVTSSGSHTFVVCNRRARINDISFRAGRPRRSVHVQLFHQLTCVRSAASCVAFGFISCCNS